MDARVWNKRDSNIPEGAIYVGRPSKWGNPFEIGKDGNRAEVVASYDGWLHNTRAGKALLDALGELKGKHLVCWCAPQACHADVLLELANRDISNVRCCHRCGEMLDDENISEQRGLDVVGKYCCGSETD